MDPWYLQRCVHAYNNNKKNKNTRSVKHTQEGFPDAPVRINPVKRT
jgi:hypothetical protein